MTVFTYGNEWDAFVPTNVSNRYSTGSDRYDSTYSRGAMNPQNARGRRYTFPTEQAEVWVHCNATYSGTSSAGYSLYVIGVRDNLGARICGMRPKSPGTVKLCIGPTASAPVSEIDIIDARFFNTPVVNFELDLHIVIAEAGSLTLYANGVIVGQLLGDTRPASGTGAAMVEMLGTSSSAAVTDSQVVIANENTIGMHVHTVAFTGFEGANDWSGLAADVVVFAKEDDNNPVTSNVDGDILALENSFASTLGVGQRVHSLTVSARTSVEVASAVDQLTGYVDDGVIAYAGDSFSIVGATYRPINQRYDVDPATGLPWVFADISNRVFGFTAETA